ncbi:MAG: enolase C-terminal domain-like protein, partial [Pseudomonadota bacterium]|nr:enolase C-terminal domain-like protein [Pseudomonadota bacterium]
ARGLSIHPHSSMTALNMVASLHLLAAIDNPGYFEADATSVNPFRTELAQGALDIGKDGRIAPPELPGLGVEVDEAFLQRYPLVEGPCYV